MIIGALAAASYFYLGFVLVLRSFKTNTLANRWLAVFLVFIGGLQLDDAMAISKTYLNYPCFFGVFDLPIFAIAPSMYLATYHFTSPNVQFKARSAWHFVPAFLFFLLNLPTLLDDRQSKLLLIEEMSLPTRVISAPELVFFALLFLQCVVYLFLSFRRMIRHQQNIPLFNSDTSRVNLKWLKNFHLVIVMMLILWIFEIAFHQTFFDGSMNWFYLIAVYILGSYAITQSEVYPFSRQELQEIQAIIEEKPVPTPAALPIEAAQKKRLLEIIEGQKLYLDPELSLPKLAQKMQCSTHDVSHLINQGFQCNFYQLINKYRIEESKRLLLDPNMQHLNILAIGFEAGFNSKTTFNTQFKAQVGVSPLEYRNQEQINNEA
jgi:AraC-like DNA-binding protein